MVIERGCESMGLGEEGKGKAKLTSHWTASRTPSILHCDSLFLVSEWFRSVYEDRSGVANRLKEQKGRARFGACGGQGACGISVWSCLLTFWD